MEWKLVTYIAYVLLSVMLTFRVARSLHRNGKVFLVSVFDGDDELAGSVNHLLVVGFYLINLGFVSFMLRTGGAVPAATDSVELLSRKMGLVLLVLGIMHFANLYVLNRMRRRRLAPARPGPVPFGAYPGAPAAGPYPGNPGGSRLADQYVAPEPRPAGH